MGKKHKNSNAVVIKIVFFNIILLAFILFLLIQANHISILTKSSNENSPTPTIYPWDTPIKSWTMYKSNRFSFKYPSTMRVIVTNTEPNAVSGNFDALDITISQDNVLDMDIRIEPTDQLESASYWAVSHRNREIINCPNCNQFTPPTSLFNFNGIQGVTQTLTTGMLLGTQLYYPLGNNIIWISLGENDHDKSERLRHLQQIDLRVK